MAIVFKTLKEAFASYDTAVAASDVEKSEQQRTAAVEQFPKAAWPTMNLEHYAVGQHKKDTFCYVMEWGTAVMGSIRGGSSSKLIIYKYANSEGWSFSSDYENEQAAWIAVRDGFIQALDLAEKTDWVGIDAIESVEAGPALLVKTLYLYYPDAIIPVCTRHAMKHFLGLLGKTPSDLSGLGPVQLNRLLLGELKTQLPLEGWTTKEMERFLYATVPPAANVRWVRVAIPEDSGVWADCVAGSYICYGRDEMGDLSEFDSKDSFESEFIGTFGTLPGAKKKARELWTLVDLSAGDRVVATQGNSRVLAVGQVLAPGYEWKGERDSRKHTVGVKWDLSTACEVPPQNPWGLVDIGPVRQPVRKLILQAGTQEGTLHAEPDEVFPDIEAGLDAKGQAVLYGPPGTGKTYTAQRFAAWWLMKDEDPGLASAALDDKESLWKALDRLSRAQASPRTWWVVANPKEWSWDQLFADGSVKYRYGRLQRNYSLVQPKDLVIGYQATPDKRVMALARVTAGLTSAEAESPYIGFEPITKVDKNNSLSYDELLEDPILSQSEPIRFRNQGTLFALTENEADQALALLLEKDSTLQNRLADFDPGSGVGRLTQVTFHPSYSYEDFIEGYRPVPSTKEGLVLAMTDGLFKQVCLEARLHPNKHYLVLIDELNRANVAKVFGETITLLEKDKRRVVTTLPQSREPFSVPENVFVLGTMNTADRSIKLLDAALRRRFAFVELMPDTTLFAGFKVGPLNLDTFLESLNAVISKREGREKQIGHSFFLVDGTPISDAEEFSRVFRQEILPLLQEYCYEDYTRLAEYLGPDLVDAESKTFKADTLGDADALLAALDKRFRLPGTQPTL